MDKDCYRAYSQPDLYEDFSLSSFEFLTQQSNIKTFALMISGIEPEWWINVEGEFVSEGVALSKALKAYDLGDLNRIKEIVINFPRFLLKQFNEQKGKTPLSFDML